MLRAAPANPTRSIDESAANQPTNQKKKKQSGPAYLLSTLSALKRDSSVLDPPRLLGRCFSIIHHARYGSPSSPGVAERRPELALGLTSWLPVDGGQLRSALRSHRALDQPISRLSCFTVPQKAHGPMKATTAIYD